MLLLYTLLGSILSIFLFGIISVYNVLFIFFVFFYTLALYFLVLHHFKKMLVIVPLMLSLASYSLIYGVEADSNFYIAINNALYTLAAMAVIFAGLFIFPKSIILIFGSVPFSKSLPAWNLYLQKFVREKSKLSPFFRALL
ncbi:hypothetical protein PGH44_15715 [Legionella pneumophila]|nr:hypothetical protein PGH44_15715 [Legionella pneumophila]